MKKLWRENKKFLTAMVFVFCFVCTVFTTKQLQVTAVANTTSAAEFSFVPMAQAAAQFLNHCMNPMNNSELPNYVNMQANGNFLFGNGGGLLGYQDEWEQEASFTISGTQSANTVEYFYNTLRDNITYEGGNNMGSAFVGYGYYGFALSEMGLDETAMSGTSKSARQILGIIMLALYSMATSVTQFFNLVFGLLSFANPYRLFLGSLSVIRTQILGSAGPGLRGLSIGDGTVQGVYYGSNLQGAIEGSNGFSSSMLMLVNKITEFYNDLYSFSKTLILPLMLAFALFSWLVLKGGRNFVQVFKPFFMKVLFVMLGVPLMFAAYSAALDVVRDFVIPENSVSASVVMTTFFDFEKWVYNTRLSWQDVSDDIVLDIDNDGTPSLSAETAAKSRGYLAELNKINYEAAGFTFSIPSLIVNNENAAMNMHKYNTTMLDSSGANRSLSQMSTSGNTNDEAFLTAVRNMLQRYTAGDVVSASSYQSSMTSTIVNNAKGDEIKMKQVLVEFAVTQSWQNFHADSAEFFKTTKGDGAIIAGLDLVDYDSDTVKAMAKTRFQATSSYTVQKELWSTGGMYCSQPPGQNGSGTVTIKHLSNGGGVNSIFGRNRPYGLSIMAMYNYLCSSFDSSKITVYSAVNTTSDQVQIGHYAVTTVGTGVMKWIYLLDAIALLGCCTVLGYGYAGGLLIANFKAIFKMIPNVMTGMLGSLRGIASAFALTAAMIVELMGTCLLYGIATDIIYLVYAAIENPLVLLLTTSMGGVSTALGAMLPVVFGLISIILIALITMKLMEWRVAICQATTEACTSFINKFVGTNVTAPNLHDGMSLTNAASMLAGAGMAAAGVMGMSGSDIRDAAQNGLDKLTGTNGEHGLLTGGAGGILTDEESGSLTKEEQEQSEYGVKNGNGTGEKVGKEDEASEKESEWGDEKSAEGAGGKNGADGASGGDTDVEGGTVNANIEGDVNEEEGDSIGAGDVGYNSDTSAQNYVEANEEEFLAAVQQTAQEQKDARNQAMMESPEYQAKLEAQKEAASRSSITDTNGNTADQMQVINAETGEDYTQADKDAGADFTVVDGDTGEVYTDSNGTVYADMDASQLTLDSNGNVSSISDGNGNTLMVSANDNPQKMVVDSNGVATGDLQVVNAETGETYSQMDKDSGAAYTVLDSNGEVYVDSNGTAYENMSAKDIHMDATTGQVDMIRDSDGNRSVVVNNDAQAGSIITSPNGGGATAGVQVVNSSGTTYTETDRANNEPFTVVTKDGTPYVSGDGQSFINAPSTDVSIDAATGQVNGVRDASGNISEIQSISQASANFASTTSVGGSSANVSVNSSSSNQVAMQGEVNTGSAAAVNTASGTVYAAMGAGMVAAAAQSGGSSSGGGGTTNIVETVQNAVSGSVGTVGSTIINHNHQNLQQNGGATSNMHNSNMTVMAQEGGNSGGGGTTVIHENNHMTSSENSSVNVSKGGSHSQTTMHQSGGGGGAGSVIRETVGNTIVQANESLHVTENVSSSMSTAENHISSGDHGFRRPEGNSGTPVMPRPSEGLHNTGNLSTSHTKEMIHKSESRSSSVERMESLFEHRETSTETSTSTTNTSNVTKSETKRETGKNGSAESSGRATMPPGRSFGGMTASRPLGTSKPGYGGRGGGAGAGTNRPTRV